MQLVRAPIAVDPRAFGRRTRREPSPAPQRQHSQLADDLKLFAITFLAGFVFVTAFLA